MRKKIKRIRKIKRFFFGLGLHKFYPWNKMIFLGNLGKVSHWINAQEGLKFTDFPASKIDYGRRTELHDFIIETELQGAPIDYLEFGVSKGQSFRWWVDAIKDKDSRFYGFDTFTGLPEDWGPFKAGDMSNGNKPPEIDDDRHSFYQGVFQTTLFDFLDEYKSTRKKVIHLDADLYSATLFVLTTLSPYLKSGDILLFDEFNVPMHEFKAFTEWSESFYVKCTVLGEVNNFYQVAMRID